MAARRRIITMSLTSRQRPALALARFAVTRSGTLSTASSCHFINVGDAMRCTVILNKSMAIISREGVGTWWLTAAPKDSTGKGEAFALFLRSGEPGLRGAHMASP